jgi:hypothetical protein
MMGRQGAVLAVGGMLAAVIAWEIVDMPRGNVMPAGTYGSMAKQAAPRVHLDNLQAWVSPILARPLFSPDRRPAAEMDNVAAPGAPHLPRLSGILIGPFGRSAIFANTGSKPIVLGEGGRIDAYTVKSIDAAQVQLEGPNGVQRLQPAFDVTDQEVAAPSGPPRRIGRLAHSQ